MMLYPYENDSKPATFIFTKNIAPYFEQSYSLSYRNIVKRHLCKIICKYCVVFQMHV